jgi:hypothetical protein
MQIASPELIDKGSRSHPGRTQVLFTPASSSQTGRADVEDSRLDQIGALEPKGHGQTQDAEEEAVDRDG